jgi:hypothetical protein
LKPYLTVLAYAIMQQLASCLHLHSLQIPPAHPQEQLYLFLPIMAERKHGLELEDLVLEMQQ